MLTMDVLNVLLVCFYLLRVYGFDPEFEVGIRMCEENCWGVKGCRSYEFMKDSLQCNLNTGIASKGSIVRHLSPEKTNKRLCSWKGCPNDGRCIRNRKQCAVCVPLHGGCKETRYRQNKEARMFLVPVLSENETTFHQMNLRTKEIQEYKHYKIGNVASLCYLSSSNKLLISVFLPEVLLSHQVDTNFTRQLKKGAVYVKMAADEGKKLLFSLAYATHFKSEFKRESLTGQQEATFPVEGRDYGPLDLTIDTANDLVILCFSRVIVSVNYDGNDKKVLQKWVQIISVTANPAEGYIYFNNKKHIKKASIFKRSSQLVATASAASGSLLYFKGAIYFRSAEKRRLVFSMVNLTDKDRRVYPIKTKLKQRSWIMCLAAQ